MQHSIAHSTTCLLLPISSIMKTLSIRGTKSRKARKSRRVYDFDFNFLSRYFHMPQKEAAAVLNVSVITIKRNCKHYGFKWPYRANKYKSRSEVVLSEKARAFHELPLECMKKQNDTELQQSSECDTDTESNEDDDVTTNYCEILFMLKASQ
ncbi:putative RWP-RK domain-containing protein [Plasmopara halstedii]